MTWVPTLGNLWRRLALPAPIGKWSLTNPGSNFAFANPLVSVRL
jgi:hypothetical protein